MLSSGLLCPQVDRVSSDASATHDQQLGVLAGLHDGLSGLSERVDQQVAQLHSTEVCWVPAIGGLLIDQFLVELSSTG
jgi:hypothetical protein